ncbi:MAG: tRNA (guanosine(37)-N1)-methyltransferase TrmD [Candidatus Omnitrophica bacterium]|nr:tRNA (guanosine(37)-N1)-methyltransferase TrmD [Candidatus Omnitrophota bacterium]
MTIDILTLFPKMFSGVTSESIIKRAQKSKKIKIRIHDIRDHTTDKHRKVDDKPFGGGPGMVLCCQPIMDALAKVKKLSPQAKVILLTPKGVPLDQAAAQSISKEKALILIAGHYEGIDERVRQVVDEEISIGDYILTGGELPAMVLLDAVVRLLPGVLGHEESALWETFADGLLEYPQYTRPGDYNGEGVPEVLVSGNHNSIRRWRKLQSVLKTIRSRPDLIKNIKQLEGE